MFENFPLFPEAASTAAREIDTFYLALVAISGVMASLIFLLIIFFAIKYRRRSEMEIPPVIVENRYLEYSWLVIPFIVFMGIFLWGSVIYFRASRMPEDALVIHVVAKQWMWKFQHPGGQSEINDLHVPVGQPVRLVMGSEDVIHSFFVPEFRVHTDVLPNRYRYTWFEVTKAGVYNLFCSEYCGTDHSGMIGKVYAMEPGAYQAWLAGGAERSPAAQGAVLFQQFACDTCHTEGAQQRGPVLTGMLGSPIRLQDGSTVLADESYVRESIVNPRAKIVQGFQSIMPSFEGQLTEEQILQLIAYIRSLSPPTSAVPPLAVAPGVPSEMPRVQQEAEQEEPGLPGSSGSENQTESQ